MPSRPRGWLGAVDAERERNPAPTLDELFPRGTVEQALSFTEAMRRTGFDADAIARTLALGLSTGWLELDREGRILTTALWRETLEQAQAG